MRTPERWSWRLLAWVEAGGSWVGCRERGERSPESPAARERRPLARSPKSAEPLGPVRLRWPYAMNRRRDVLVGHARPQSGTDRPISRRRGRQAFRHCSTEAASVRTRISSRNGAPVTTSVQGLRRSAIRSASALKSTVTPCSANASMIATTSTDALPLQKCFQSTAPEPTCSGFGQECRPHCSERPAKVLSDLRRLPARGLAVSGVASLCKTHDAIDLVLAAGRRGRAVRLGSRQFGQRRGRFDDLAGGCPKRDVAAACWANAFEGRGVGGHALRRPTVGVRLRSPYHRPGCRAALWARRPWYPIGHSRCRRSMNGPPATGWTG